MKIRNGFVSNSSSSSFIIHITNVSDEPRCMVDFLLENSIVLEKDYDLYEDHIKTAFKTAMNCPVIWKPGQQREFDWSISSYFDYLEEVIPEDGESRSFQWVSTVEEDEPMYEYSED